MIACSSASSVSASASRRADRALRERAPQQGLSLDEIHAWWLARLDLPASCLRAASVNRPSKASRWRRNVLLYGTARVAVHSTEIVQRIYGAIQAYGAFDREAWVA
jgi:hypothetical protein